MTKKIEQTTKVNLEPTEIFADETICYLLRDGRGREGERREKEKRGGKREKERENRKGK